MTKAIKSSKFKDSNCNLSKTYVISKPGIYHLCSSIEFVPITQGQSAIQILSDDVTLDLCGHILSQTNTIQNVTGVKLGSDTGLDVFKNITVKNGKITAFTGQAIGAFNSVESGGVFENLTFSELDCSECGSDSNTNYASGINLQSNVEIDFGDYFKTYRNVTIEHCQVNNCLGNGAIAVYTCDGLIINNTQANNTSATVPNEFTIGVAVNPLLGFGANMVGIGVYGNNIQLTNVQTNDTHCANFPIISGLQTWYSNNIVLKHCYVNGITSSGDILLTYAIDASFCDNVQIDGCQFNDVLSKGFPSFEVGNGIVGTNVFVTDTLFNNARCEQLEPADGRQVFGNAIAFSFGPGNNHYYLNCQFNNAFMDTGAQVQGCNASGVDNAVFENCQFNNTEGGPGVFYVNGVHSSDSVGQTQPTQGQKYINCQFNGAKGYNNVAGFVTITNRDWLFDGCQSMNHQQLGGSDINFFQEVYGFTVFTSLLEVPAYPGNTYNITFRNCVVSDIQGADTVIGINTGAAINGYTYVGAFEGGETKNIVIQNCIVERLSSSSVTAFVAGIAEIIVDYIVALNYTGASSIPQLSNLSVTKCRISDIRAGAGNPLSAGILVQNTQSPVLSDNSVSDCDRGILFTGACLGFQLAISLDPLVLIDLLPSSPDYYFVEDGQIFDNTTRTDIVTEFATNSEKDYILKPQVCTAGWQTGDSVVYTNTGISADVPGLVSGTTYFVVMYTEYTTRGLVQENKVTNCSVSGYQDDQVPTSSGWINNVALLNGTTHSDNYAITWASGVPQVDKGTLGEYPTVEHKYWNLSITQ